MKKLLAFLTKTIYNREIEWARSQGYDEGISRGYNMGYQLGQVEKNNYSPDNNIVKAWESFYSALPSPRVDRELDEILKDKGVE